MQFHNNMAHMEWEIEIKYIFFYKNTFIINRVDQSDVKWITDIKISTWRHSCYHKTVTGGGLQSITETNKTANHSHTGAVWSHHLTKLEKTHWSTERETWIMEPSHCEGTILTPHPIPSVTWRTNLKLKAYVAFKTDKITVTHHIDLRTESQIKRGQI